MGKKTNWEKFVTDKQRFSQKPLSDDEVQMVLSPEWRDDIIKEFVRYEKNKYVRKSVQLYFGFRAESPAVTVTVNDLITQVGKPHYQTGLPVTSRYESFLRKARIEMWRILRHKIFDARLQLPIGAQCALIERCDWLANDPERKELSNLLLVDSKNDDERRKCLVETLLWKSLTLDI